MSLRYWTGASHAAWSEARTLVVSSPMASENGVGLNLSSDVSSTTLNAASSRNSRPVLPLMPDHDHTGETYGEDLHRQLDWST